MTTRPVQADTLLIPSDTSKPLGKKPLPPLVNTQSSISSMQEPPSPVSSLTPEEDEEYMKIFQNKDTKDA